MGDLLDRPFPQSIESERAILGGLLQRADQIPEIATILEPGDFYRSEHRHLYTLLQTMSEAREPIDLVTVSDRIVGRSELYGGLGYVVDLPESIPSTANLPHYARAIAHSAQLREVIRIARSAAERAYMSPEDPGALIDDLISELGRARGEDYGAAPAASVSDAVQSFVDQKEAEHTSGKGLSISTGVDSVDTFKPIKRSMLTILAARPSMGKTAMALNWAHRAAVDGSSVGFVSLEMSGEEIAMRLISSYGSIPMDLLEDASMWDQVVWDRVLQAQADMAEDTGGRLRSWCPHSPTISQIRSQALRWKMQGGLDLLVIDYLDLIGHDPREEHHEALGRIAAALKQLAKELSCSVVLLHAVNRASASTKTGEAPTMAQLSGCGKLEYHGDVICFPHRPGYYDDEQDQNFAQLVVGKNRQGRCGTADMRWRGDVQRFEADRGEL